MRSFDKIMADVDAEIGALREGSEKTAAAGEDVLDLAAQLRTSAQGVGAPVSAGIDPALVTMTEKVAHAIAITDTLLNLDTLVKMAEFEKKAMAKGFSQEQIETYMAKTASAKGGLTTVMSALRKAGPRAGAAGVGVAAGGAGGAALGHKKGKETGQEEGYIQALGDVNRAMQAHAMA